MSRIYLEYSDDVDGLGTTYRLHISKIDQAGLKLSRFDNALLDDIKNGPPSSTPIADKLLGLEMIVRRIEEAANIRRVGKSSGEPPTKGKLAQSTSNKEETK